MKPARFLLEAEWDLIDAVDWYDHQRSGLGRIFNAAVRATVAKILRDPESHAEISEGVRRRRVLRFPFDVLFGMTATHVLIVAIMHHQRSPQSWTGRWPSE